ncbi:N-acetylmuramic acid 6-phosphate etherase [Deinococcus yavapaiensis]|uniref:N-acetylmuramic acid 6-phosphate etherase n=1 Tax=Deinococcus yavapaiensis KR-236 TaxID=694435 RepID=A0A318SCQ8_9DEIO|nr:N-acetylmuramic acid 6-phosphate etherase [Deinococcus yavapaiensis]PYE54148.1 N-acetylmuramic acid 6-phosphate etherase [Deinococcus yavapaiensis KR-236]
MTLLDTERLSEQYRDLDLRSTNGVVAALLEDQARAVTAVRDASDDLSRAVDLAAEFLARGGRLVYVGAGTSGRLACLDAAELPPTFSWPPSRAVALLAGGREAMWEAREGAEDDEEAGVLDLRQVQLSADDVLIAIAASGTTPYALAGLRYAKAVGALTIAFANNPGTPLLTEADVGVCLHSGPEVISGSTRLKAGTAQKIALNTFSSAVMVRLGKVLGNLMVDVRPTNAKLRERAVRLVVTATNASETEARAALEASGFRVAVSVVSLLRSVDTAEAQRLLDAAGGHVRRALT